jgi:hypothetical protein
MSFDQLCDLWERNAPKYVEFAAVMASIALAESSGNPKATNFNTNATEDRGLWQVNSGAWPQFNPPYDLFDPDQNAKAALEVFEQQGLTAWSTWNNGAAATILVAQARSAAA